MTAGTSTSLSTEQREKFARDGYMVIDNPCSPDLLDAVIAEADELYRDAFHPGPEVTRDEVVFTRHPGLSEKYHWNRVKNAWKVAPNIRAAALAPRVLAITEELFGRDVLPFQTLNFPVGTQQPPHIDAFFFHSDPPGFMCGVWIALEDMDMENGPLLYYPGSHKLPLPDWSEISRVTGVPFDRSNYATQEEYEKARIELFTRYCQETIEQHGFEPEYATIRKGQAVVWAPNLMHGGAPQRDMSRTRNSLVTHYFFEGCRHYTPLHTQGDHIFWDYHEWIREPPPDGTIETLKGVIESKVPADATLLVDSRGYDALLALDDRRAWPFPQAADGTQADEAGVELVNQLESLRADGAEYAVFPKDRLLWLEYVAPELQEHLENRYRAVLRDAAYCVIYALDGS